MSHRKYALEVISDVGLAGSKPSTIPREPNQKLTTTEYADYINNEKDDRLLTNPTVYLRLVGRLIF